MRKMRNTTDVNEGTERLRWRFTRMGTYEIRRFVLGTVVGATLYASFADKSEREVRADIADAASQAKEYVQETVEEISQAIE